MSFLRITDKTTGGVRCFNTDYVVEMQPDEDGATIWYVSYATAGQPLSKYVDTRETLDELLAQLDGASTRRTKPAASPAAASGGG